MKTLILNSSIGDKRQELRELSNALKWRVKETEEFATLNEAIISHYKEQDPNIKRFETYNKWQEEGYQVKKGERAFLVWGRPKNTDKEKQKEESDDKGDFYPVAYLFANTQVEPKATQK